jgi:hypothetical protein
MCSLRLIIEANAIEKIMKTFVNFCERYLEESHYNKYIVCLNFSKDSYPAILRRALYMLKDVEYLITVVPKPSEWKDSLRTNFIRGVSAYLHFLSYVQVRCA